MNPVRLLFAILLLLPACRKTPTPSAPAHVELPPGHREVLDAVFNTIPEGEVKAIQEVKQTARPGDKVTFSGRIMGNAEPFVQGRAAFILADPSILTACSDKPGDLCETPWDTCCDTPKDKLRAIATIQIVDAADQIIKQGLEGTAGLAKLSEVTVSGTVAPGSAGDVLIIHASAIQVSSP